MFTRTPERSKGLSLIRSKLMVLPSCSPPATVCVISACRKPAAVALNVGLPWMKVYTPSGMGGGNALASTYCASSATVMSSSTNFRLERSTGLIFVAPFHFGIDSSVLVLADATTPLATPILTFTKKQVLPLQGMVIDAVRL